MVVRMPWSLHLSGRDAKHGAVQCDNRVSQAEGLTRRHPYHTGASR